MDGLFYTMNNQLIYTVTQINNYSSDILKKELSNVWVTGEISSLKKYPSGYTYITLKDSKSELSCLCNYQLDPNIVEGMEVTINGSADIYTFKGNYQFRVSNIFLKGQGDLWLKYSKIKAKLEKEGLFDSNHKKKIPTYAQNIGIITSLEGSVLSDIRNIIKRRSPHVKLFLINSRVSGNASIDSLCESIQNFNQLNYIDVIILARGGGSIEDLSVFNEERLVREIFKSNIPIISAIGHETDFTLSDFVSDLRASTPSEAAERCCVSQSKMQDKINYDYDRIFLETVNLIKNQKRKLDVSMNILEKYMRTDFVIKRKEKVIFLYKLLYSTIANKKYSLVNLINTTEKIFKKYDDNKIKKLGYSILRKDNKIIKNPDNLIVNDIINIEMYKGNVISKIKEIND
tara:strand:- start:13362 stop:14567 length:1206 start_codon:yes stop_codon:yes gene_type:complete